MLSPPGWWPAELSAVLNPHVPAQEELSAVPNPAGSGAEATWRRPLAPGRGEIAAERRTVSPAPGGSGQARPGRANAAPGMKTPRQREKRGRQQARTMGEVQGGGLFVQGARSMCCYLSWGTCFLFYTNTIVGCSCCLSSFNIHLVGTARA